MYDVIIAGGGVAGLSAALFLGRSLCRVLVCDDGRPRNARSEGLHGYLTRDGVLPGDFRRLARRDLRRYGTVEVRRVTVDDARRNGDGFEITLTGGEHLKGRKLLLATGVVDNLPAVAGAKRFFGRGVFHCPYCDGWEVRGRPLAAYGRGRTGLGLALELTNWSRDVVLCSGGPAGLTAADRARLGRHGVGLREERILSLEGRGGRLECVRFAGGPALARSALFFSPAWRQRSDLAVRLGCRFDTHGLISAGRKGSTGSAGLYVAGDAAAGEVQLAVVAASDGARAALAIHKELRHENLAARDPGSRVLTRQEA